MRRLKRVGAGTKETETRRFRHDAGVLLNMVVAWWCVYGGKLPF
jgi:hypothetical protein